MSKSSNAAVARRVDVVYELLLLGMDRADVIAHVRLNHKSWKVSTRSLDMYLARARQRMMDVAKAEQPLEFARALARKHDLYRRLVGEGDYRGALMVQKEIDAQLGLNAPHKVEITEVLAILDAEIEAKRREVEDLERQFAIEARTDP